MHDLEQVEDCVIIGLDLNPDGHSNCILIGEGLTAKYPYHMLVGTPSAMIVDRKLTKKSMLSYTG